MMISDSTAESPEPPSVGSRVSVDGYLALVKYFGTVQGQEGQWVGLDWDDAAKKGKHNGSHEGGQYFECREGELSGSFLRWDKYQKLVDVPRSIVDAVKTRYQDPGTGAGPGADADMFVSTASHRKVPVELVLDGKEKELGALTQAALSGMRICELGEKGVLAATIPLVTDLDLSCNLLSCWDVVTQLAQELPYLQTLNLSGNALRFPAPGISPCGGVQFQSLATLVLNHCGVTFSQVLAVHATLPALQALHLQGNAINRLESPGTAFPLLQVLDLESNRLSDWEEIEHVAGLPNLRQLQLSDNALKSVVYRTSPGGNGTSAFGKLATLLLGDNRIKEWGAVDQLNIFPALEDVRLTGNPVLRSEQGGGRFQVIARVGNLKMLNGSEVRPQERRDAEIRYMRLVQGQIQASSGSEDDVMQLNPRFPTLLAKYGDIGAACTTSSSGSALAADLLELRLTCLAASAGQRMGTQLKKLPGSLTLASLKVLCERLFKVPVSKQALFVRSPVDPLPQSLGDDDLRDVAYLGVQGGAEILVDEVDLEAVRAAQQQNAALEKAAHEERLAQQLRDVRRLMLAEGHMQQGRRSSLPLPPTPLSAPTL